MSICSFYQLGRKRRAKRKSQILIPLLLIVAILFIPIPTGLHALTSPTLILTPNVGPRGSTVYMTGANFGFNVSYDCWNDHPFTSLPLPYLEAPTSPTTHLGYCTITNGTLNGNFTVSPTASLGLHTLTLEGAEADFFVSSMTVTVATTTTVPTTATSTSWQTITANTTVGSTVVVPTTVTTIVSTTPTTIYGISTFYTATTYGIFTSYYFTEISYGTTTSLYAIATTTLYGLSTQTVHTAVTVETVTDTHVKTEQFYTTVGGTSTQWTTTSANTTLFHTETLNTTQTFTQAEDVTQTVTVATVTVQPPPPAADATWIYILAGIIVACVVIGLLWYFEMLPEMPDFISGIPERVGGLFRRKKPPEVEEVIEEQPRPVETLQCSNCQTINEAKTIYCTQCGVKLGTQEPKQPKEPEPTES